MFCKLSADQYDCYDSYIRSEVVERVLDGRMQSFGALTQIRKICNHSDLFKYVNLVPATVSSVYVLLPIRILYIDANWKLVASSTGWAAPVSFFFFVFYLLQFSILHTLVNSFLCSHHTFELLFFITDTTKTRLSCSPTTTVRSVEAGRCRCYSIYSRSGRRTSIGCYSSRKPCKC